MKALLDRISPLIALPFYLSGNSTLNLLSFIMKSERRKRYLPNLVGNIFGGTR